MRLWPLNLGGSVGDKKKGHEPSVEERLEALEQRLAELLEQLEAAGATTQRPTS